MALEGLGGGGARERDQVVFEQAVARLAHRHKVVELVCLQVGIVLIWDVAECAKGLDVMHVKGAVPRLLHSAATASVSIALPRCACLSVPIRPVIFFVAAAPACAIRSAKVRRRPSSAACVVTEGTRTAAKLIRLTL